MAARQPRTSPTAPTSRSIESDAASRPVTAVDRRLAAAVQRTIADGPVRLELWDGRRADGAPDRAAGDLLVGDRRALVGLAVNANLYFGEAYIAGRIRIRGSLTESDPRAVAQQRGESIALGTGHGVRRARQRRHRRAPQRRSTTTISATTSTRSGSTASMVYTCAYLRRPGR